MIKADLHIHSCLSPCGSNESTPIRIVAQALRKELDMVALTDHNCGDNLPAFFECAKVAQITPIAGMELTTQEEAHMLALLPSLDVAMEFSDFLYPHLPAVSANPQKMGDQIIVDAEENQIGTKEKYLNMALPFSLEELVDLIHRRGGLAIPAHIDRFAYSIPSALGFLPNLPFDAVESYQIPCPVDHQNLPVISDSDAHYIDDIAKRYNELSLESNCFESLKNYFEKKRKALSF